VPFLEFKALVYKELCSCWI